MGQTYIRIEWPESQYFMCFTDEEMEEYGIELGPESSYFIPTDVYDEVEKLVKERNEVGNTNVSKIIDRCLHTLEDCEEYEFQTPIEISENRIVKKFWADDGNEDVRVEIWETYPTDSWRGNAFLSEMDHEEHEDAVKVAKAIKEYWHWS